MERLTRSKIFTDISNKVISTTNGVKVLDRANYFEFSETLIEVNGEIITIFIYWDNRKHATLIFQEAA